MNATRQHILRKFLVSALVLVIGVMFRTPTTDAQPIVDVWAKPEIRKFVVVLQDGLWVVEDGKTSRIAEGVVVQAAWSPDGRWLAYLTDLKDGNEPKAWVFNVQTGQRDELLRGHSLTWAPSKNVLALQSHSTLNLYDFRGGSSNRRLVQMLGIDSYTFSPSGDVLLLGSSADLRPDGWTHAIIYKSQLTQSLSPAKPQKFFVVPKEIPLANLPGVIHPAGQAFHITAIDASHLKYNQDGNWIGFVASPTAGISADYNALCILRNDGQAWRPIGNIPGTYSGEWRFAPGGHLIGFIAGDERWPYRHKLAVTASLIDGHSAVWTPPGFADDALAFGSDSTLVVSRAKEQPSPSGPYIYPLASLYTIDFAHKQERRLTTPPAGYGDYRPQVQSGLLIWTRADRERGDVWVANTDGTDAHILVRNVGGTTQRPPVIVFPPR